MALLEHNINKQKDKIMLKATTVGLPYIQLKHTA
jgi:hypothetical protein